MTRTNTALLSAALLGLSLSGCVTGYNRGVVAMKIDDKTAHVCVRRVETSVGDRMGLYRNECTRTPPPRPHVNCAMKLVGEGTITELINEHYSLLVFDKPTDFHEGDLVEKVSR
ncbi:MAG: hypothetical protein U0871_15555 [Gemmataceae bacterium]